MIQKPATFKAPSEQQLAQDFIRVSALEGPVEALRQLVRHVSEHPALLKGALGAIETRTREIAQVAASLRGILDSQAGFNEVSGTLEAPSQRKSSAPAPSVVSDPSPNPTASASAAPARDASVMDDTRDVRQLLETLPDMSQIAENTAKRLANALPDCKITKTPRSGSRGNALLYVLSRYGRRRSLSIADLSFAFETMNVPLGNAPSYHRITSWEVRALMRHGWPITEDERGFRFNAATGTSAEGNMT